MAQDTQTAASAAASEAESLQSQVGALQREAEAVQAEAAALRQRLAAAESSVAEAVAARDALASKVGPLSALERRPLDAFPRFDSRNTLRL